MIDANQAGNANYLAAPQVQETLIIAKATQAITFTSTPPASPTVGGSYTVKATGGLSGSAVTFSIDSASTANACSIAGSSVSFTGPGTCVIDANQAGNTNYLAAPQVQQTVTIAKAAQAITFTSTPPASPVVSGNYTVKATGGGSGNPVTFSIDSKSASGACSISGATVSFTGAGSCVVDANQAGNANYSAAPQVQQLMTIAKAGQAIAFTSTPPAIPVVGGSYSVKATGGGSGNPVTFSIDSSSSAGACSISGATVSFTGGGSCVVDANQAGNNSYLAAPQAQQKLTVKVTPQGIIALTLQYVQSSAKYQALTAPQKAAITGLANLLSSVLTRVVPNLTAAQKAALINAYKAGVATLKTGGWLTSAQAATLTADASQL